jgi:hypothetical protein
MSLCGLSSIEGYFKSEIHIPKSAMKRVVLPSDFCHTGL